MRNLEQRRHAEDLCKVGAHACEHAVVEEDIARDLPAQALDGAWVAETQLSATLGERVDGVAYRVGERVGEKQGG